MAGEMAQTSVRAAGEAVRLDAEILRLQASEDERGTRLDVWIAEKAKISRSAAARLIEAGQVNININNINNKNINKNSRIAGNENIIIHLPEPELIDLSPQNIALDIIYEDADVIVINKPKGMVTHPAPGHPDQTLVNALLYHCGDTLSGIGGCLRPGIVHRIDRDTTGLIIAAKNDFAHQKLSEQLKDHTLARVYNCIICGAFQDDAGMIQAPIGRHKTDRKKMCVRPDGKDAVTHWRVLERLNNNYSLLECRLETGRTHQIRVHMAWTGHPILGDPVYGNLKNNQKFPDLRGQCLHASQLKFIHPRTGENILLTCPLPDEFQSVLKRLKSSWDSENI